MFSRSLRLLSVSIALVAAAGCGGGGGQAAIGISAVSAPLVNPVTVDAGQVVPLSVGVVNDVSAQNATIVLTGPGSLSTPAISRNGASTYETFNYTAPATVSGTATATVTATANRTPSQSASLTFNINPALSFTPSTLPGGTVGTPYSVTLVPSGGTGAFSLTATGLPPGILLSGTKISGTPTTIGSYTVTVSLTDHATVPNTVTQTFTVVIAPQPPTVTAATLPNAIAGTAYSQQLAYTGGSGSATFNLVSGPLPAGLTLSASGLISGTPTNASAGSTYPFTVSVTVGSQTSAAVSFSITVPALPAVTTTSLPSGNVGIAYSRQLQYSGGSGATPSWSSTGSLPPGITVNTSGLVSGTPTTAGSYTFSVAVTIGTQTSPAQSLTLVINSLVVTSAASANGELGLPFLFTLTAAGGTGPYTWSISSGTLPSGLTLDSATGRITGSPTVAGTYGNVVVQATDSLGATASQSMTFNISAARNSSLNSELSGQYAFLVSGFDGNGHPVAMAGKFTADGAGNITSGVADTNGSGLSAPSLSTPLLASTYSVGTDGRGKVQLTTASGSMTFTLALANVNSGVAGNGFLSEFDATSQRLSGTLALQNSAAFTTSSFSGGFAFGVQGFSAASTPQHRAVIGEVQMNSTGGSNSGELIESALGSQTPNSITATSLAILPTGRGTLSFTLSGGAAPLNFVVYVVSPTRLLLLSSSATPADLLLGDAQAQTVTNGSFNSGTLDGAAVMELAKLSPQGVTGYVGDVQAGVATFDGAGHMSYSFDENTGGTSSSNTTSGTYTIASNGRVALTFSAGLGGCIDCASLAKFAYLAGADQGYVLDLSTAAAFGTLQPQTVSTFNAGLLNSTLAAGTVVPLTTPAATATAELSGNGAGTVTGTGDFSNNTVATPDLAVATTASVGSNGRTVLSTVNGDTWIVYPVSATQWIGIDDTALDPFLLNLLH
jgi:hypothetical protein